MDRVRDQSGLRDLLGAIQQVATLTTAAAEAALAAFIRVRLAVAGAKQRVDIRGLAVGVSQLVDAVTRFVNEDSEGGKRGQALVAAAFDVAFDQVRMGRVNDPSRRLPGDVQVMDGARVTLAAEARQKLVALDDVVAFASSLREGGVGKGVVAALEASQRQLDRGLVQTHCEREHGVLVSVVDSPAELLILALTWSRWQVDSKIGAFPNCFAARLEEIEVPSSSVRRWATLVRAADDG